ncbi:MAG: DUF4129 domain-containing protein [Actinomycetota bacterium]
MILIAVDPDAARRDAVEILGGREYRRDPAPRPFRGVLEWIGDRLEPIFDFIGRVLSAIPWWLWLVIAFAVIGFVVALYIRRVERRTASGRGRGAEGTPSTAQEDPRELDRAAEAAERAGDFARAVRLRFRAGLLRLGTRGQIVYRPSVTTTEVRRVLGSETFDQLAGTFEQVAYGGRAAAPPDVAEARAHWPRVHDEARASR